MSRIPMMATPLRRRAHRRHGYLRDWALRAAGVSCLLALSVALGKDVAALGGGEPEVGLVLAGAGAVLGCLSLVALGPVACLAVVGGLAAAGLLPVLGQVAGADLTLADAFYVGAVAGWLPRMLREGDLLRTLREGESADRGARAGSGLPQVPALAFLAFAGLTLWHVQLVDPARFEDSLISWLRLVQTASLAWLAALVVETKKDLTVVLGAIAAGGSVAVLLTVQEAITVGGNPLVDRYAATLDLNALGLMAGLLVVFAACGTPSLRSSHRVMLGMTGLVGLVLAKSVGAFVATGLAMALGASFTGRRSPLDQATRVVVALLIAGVLVFGVVQYLRPSSTPADAAFRDSSASHRIIVGAAGLEVFERNPMIGAGWRRSDSPAVIGDPEIASELRSRFPGARQDFFPDINPTSVHNTYVQILADLGLIGFGLFVAAIASIGLAIRRLLGRVRGSELWPPACASALGLTLILLWLNDNPLYGGQVETIILALFVGTLAAIGRQAGAAAGQGRRRDASAQIVR